MNTQELALRGTHALFTRVERWECDYNNHWNVRFYGRSFQMASEVLAARQTGENAGAAIVHTRHIRFHKELFVSAPVTIRSARVDGGPQDGAVVHLLSSDGRLAASSLEQPGPGATLLPGIPAADLALALPRSIKAEPHAADWPMTGDDQVFVLGPVRPAELDHTGALLTEDLFKRVALVSHHQLAAVGYTAAFVKETGLTRMSVENKVTRHADPRPGDIVQARSRIVHVGGKAFNVCYRLEGSNGSAIATAEQCFVTVDLNSRRAVEVPGFLRDAIKPQAV